MVGKLVWSEYYRPKTVNDVILPDHIKQIFQQFVNTRSVPNLLLIGPPGVGKTSIAEAMLRELDAGYKFINGSIDGNIDTLRNDIKNFASSVSFDGDRKYVILDEADFINLNSTQPALRGFIEEFSNNCGFILTCNYPGRIMKELRSRCAEVDFKLRKEDRANIANQYWERAKHILKVENVQYDPKVVGEIVKKYFPDFRRVLNELQKEAAHSNSITTAILSNSADENIKVLFDAIKAKNFQNIRKWVGENSDVQSTDIFRKVYDYGLTVLSPQSIGPFILITSKYQYQSYFVADQEINFTACVIEIMTEAIFK